MTNDSLSEGIIKLVASMVKQGVEEGIAAALANKPPPAKLHDDKHVSIPEAAAIVRCGKGIIRLAIETGALRSNRIPRARGRAPGHLIKRRDLEAWLKSGAPTEPAP
jgi:hypothetical protein